MAKNPEHLRLHRRLWRYDRYVAPELRPYMPDAVVYVRPRNEADTDWDAGVTINATESGLIGVKAVTINSNGLVNCYVTGLNDPSRVKVRISR